MLRQSMAKALANLAPATSIRFGYCVSRRTHTNWSELIPPLRFRQLFPGLEDYAGLERLLSSKRADYTQLNNRWQDQLPRIRRLRHLVYRVIQDAEYLLTNFRFPYGLRDFAIGFDYWHAGLTVNGLLHPREARYLYVLKIFLTRTGIIDLAANARKILYARFDAPRDLWTLVHTVIDRLDPPADDFDLDKAPVVVRREGYASEEEDALVE